jgi:cysteinyl-tRNA synthetase
LTRIDECLLKLRELAGSQEAPAERAKSPVIDAFTKVLDDDLNISAAWGTVFDWVRDTNRRLTDASLTSADARAALGIWAAMDSVLGVGPLPEPTAPPEMLALLEARQAARKSKDFKKADEIRNELKAKGWTIEDTPKGTRLRKKCEGRRTKGLDEISNPKW